MPRRPGGGHLGSIRIGERERPPTSLPKDRDIAMVFQDYALYPHMTVRTTSPSRSSMRKRPKAEIERRSAMSPGCSSLEPLLQRSRAQLSGGSASASRSAAPSSATGGVFLMDEPLSNLDAKLRAKTRAEIEQLQQRTRHHHRLRHPRPGRGDDARRPDRGHARRRPRAVPRPDEVYERPANPSSPASSHPAMSLARVWARAPQRLAGAGARRHAPLALLRRGRARRRDRGRPAGARAALGAEADIVARSTAASTTSRRSAARRCSA